MAGGARLPGRTLAEEEIGREARGYGFGCVCFDTRHSPGDMGPQGMPVRHLDLVFRLARQDRYLAAVALQAGAQTDPEVHGLVGRKGALPQLFHDSRGRGVPALQRFRPRTRLFTLYQLPYAQAAPVPHTKRPTSTFTQKSSLRADLLALRPIRPIP